MKWTFNGDKNWMKISAAALLSVGVLAGCGDGDDDTDVDVNNPAPAEVVPDDGGNDTDVDVNNQAPAEVVPDDGVDDTDIDVDVDEGSNDNLESETDDNMNKDTK